MGWEHWADTVINKNKQKKEAPSFITLCTIFMLIPFWDLTSCSLIIRSNNLSELEFVEAETIEGQKSSGFSHPQIHTFFTVELAVNLRDGR